MTRLPRNWRLCFRLTRRLYWWLKDVARVMDTTPSTVVFWALQAMHDQWGDNTEDMMLAWVEQVYDPEDKVELQRLVDKALAVLRDDEVPW